MLGALRLCVVSLSVLWTISAAPQNSIKNGLEETNDHLLKLIDQYVKRKSYQSESILHYACYIHIIVPWTLKLIDTTNHPVWINF